MKSRKYIILVLSFALSLSLFLFGLPGEENLWAQRFSYVYIQGDQKTPFYVKFEGEMLPRYGKNYCIISELAPGPVNLEILFQQHAYPPATFRILVPENGFRGFLLTQTDTGFSLYDIHQQFYLPSGNSLEEDQEPQPPSPRPSTPESLYPAPGSRTSGTGIEALKTSLESLWSKAGEIPRKVAPRPESEPPPPPSRSQDLEFLDYLELRGPGNTEDLPPIPNSDCPQPLSNQKFETLYRNTSQRPVAQRMKYLFDQSRICLSTNQAKQLALSLSTEAEKFTFLKRIYPRITDQHRFAELDSLFDDPEWKLHFHQLIWNP